MGLGSRLVRLVVIMASVVGIGTMGYRHLEGWPWLDSLYMTVITMFSVGFKEVHDLSDHGRLFTMLLIVMGVGTLAYGLTNITEFVVEGQLGHLFRRKRMERRIQQATGHVVLCGAGQTGRACLEEMARAGAQVVVIEKDETTLRRVIAHRDVPHILGDATDEETLERAGIGRARALLAALQDDTSNLYVVMSARDLNSGLTIITKATSAGAERKMRQAGADHIVSPNMLGGQRMASLILRPGVVAFLDEAIRSKDLALRLEESPIPEGSSLADKKLAEARIPQATGLMVIAIRKSDGAFLFNPTSDTVLRPADVLIVLGSPEQTGRLREYVGAIP
jgi:voltage-gated potassium channel